MNKLFKLCYNKSKGTTMYYCEKCNFASADDVCKVCGKGNLRKINGDDFCYFTSLLAFDYEMYESALKSKNIDVVGMPYYTHAVSLSSAGRAQGRRVYVRYKDFPQAREAFDIIFRNNS